VEACRREAVGTFPENRPPTRPELFTIVGVQRAWLEFAVAATLVILAPGPDSMLVLRNALRGGRRAGLSTAAGTVTGLLSWAVAAALGVSALLEASRVGYDALRLAGGAYLVWLGINALRRRRPVPMPTATATPATEATPEQAAGQGTTSPGVNLRRAYLNGVISNACNPKIGVFFIAFLPNVMPAGAPAREVSLLFGGWFAVETGLWLATVVWMADHAKRWLGRPRWQRRLERVTGLVLIGLGIRVATEARGRA
jgi:threonine/homoserine/homoserine lactone efflux protein